MFSVACLRRVASRFVLSFAPIKFTRIRSKLFVGLFLLLGLSSSAFANESLLFVEAQQSSTGFGGVPERAIDGNTNGRYGGSSVTHTNTESQPWWAGTFESDALVTEVTLWNRTDNCCTSRLADFYLLVSDQPFQSNDLAATLADENVWSSFHAGTVDGSVTIPVNSEGRYVRVQLQGTGVLSLAEVVVMGMEPHPITTLALQDADQSSTRFLKGVPGGAIDGNTDGAWQNGSVTHTNNELQPWWNASLADEFMLTDVTLWNRTDCCADRLIDFHLLVSNQPFQSNDLATTLADENVWSSFHAGTVDGFVTIPVNTVGRYVRVQLDNLGTLSLAEVVVTGYPVSTETTGPVAVDDFATVDRAGSVEIAVLSNDTVGADFAGLIDITAQPSNGTVSIVVGNDPLTVSYTPFPDTAGDSDSFEYTITNSLGASDAAVVSITIIGDIEPVDTTAPIISLLGLDPQVLTVGDTFNDPGATAVDAVDGDVAVTVISNTVDASAEGEYEIVYSATDAAGNSATLARSIVVIAAPDTVGPVITLTGANPIELTVDGVFADPGATAVDAVDGDVAVTVTSNTVDASAEGEYEIVYSATDAAGNTTTLTRVVVVTTAPDTVGPVITLTGANPIELTVDGVFADPGATAVDAVDGDVEVTVTSNTVDASAEGEYEIVYSATDAAGNTTTLTRVVVVTTAPDTVGPVITLTGANPIELTVDGTFTDPGATAVDAVDGDVAVTVTSNTVDVSAEDEYEVVYSATDAAGNTTTATRAVIVSPALDTEPPVITILGENPAQLELGDLYTDAGATADDVSEGVVSVTISSNNVDINNVGSYTVVYEAADSVGNTASATRVVNISDGFDVGPVITLIGPRTHEIGVGSAYQEFGVSALDGGGSSVPVTITDNVNDNVSGSYQVTYSATDSLGNTASKTRTIVVKDLPLARSLSSPIPQTGAVVSFEPGDDGDYQAGAPRDYQHDLVADMVYDNTYDIFWQDSLDNTVEQTWDAANAACSSLVLGGYSDWRLPSTFELAFLVDFGQVIDREGRFMATAIDPEFLHRPIDTFPLFWSADTANSGNFRTVSFLTGSLSQDERNDTRVNYYRCVRGTESNFTMQPVKTPDEVSYDIQNRLMWQDNSTVSDTELNWPDALQYCEDLSLNNAEDWRLPNRNEMLVLVRYTIGSRIGPFDNPGLFNNLWWTSSVDPDETLFDRGVVTWEASASRGNIRGINDYDDRVEHVRCVRDFLSPTAVSQGDLDIVIGNGQLDGSASFDLDGSIVSYQWKQSGFFGRPFVVAEGAVVSADIFGVGSHDIFLEVSDNHGVVATDEFTLIVRGNQEPRINVFGDNSISASEPIEFTARFSSDPDGTIDSYLWELDGTVVGREADLFISVQDKPAQGRYELKITVTDNGGATRTGIRTLDLLDDSGVVGPIADAGPDITIIEGELATFDGSNSSYQGGAISLYNWKMGNRSLSLGPVFSSDTFTVGTYAIELEVSVSGINRLEDTDIVILTVVEATDPPPPDENLPPVADDLTISTLEDTAVTLNLIASDPNPGTSLLFSIETLPVNGIVVLENDDFIYTPNANYVGTDTLNFKVNDGVLDSNVATVSIVVEDVNDAPVADAGPNLFATEGERVTLDGSGSFDDGLIVSYTWILNGQQLGTGSTIALTTLEVGQNFVELEVVDDVGLSSTDTVLVDVSPATPAGFTISSVAGNTVTVGSRATFSVALTTPPSADVTIGVSSSNSIEGVALQSSITFTPLDWDDAQAIIIEGRNPAVFNGNQNYQIILEPADSSDLNYSGLDPDDVEIRGIDVMVEDFGEDVIFVANLSQSYRPVFDTNGTGTASYRLVSAPAGVSIDEFSGTVSWTPPLSAEGGNYTVTILTEINDLSFENSLTIRVPSSTVISGSFSNNTLVVSDSDSSFDDFEFRLTENSSSFTVREVPSTSLPSLQEGAELITHGFYAENDVPLDLYVPIERLSDPYSITRLEYFTWQAEEGFWSSSSFDVEAVQVNQRWYAKLTLLSVNGEVGVIGLRPVLDPNLVQIDTSYNTRSVITGTRASINQTRSIDPSLLNLTPADVSCVPRNWTFLDLNFVDYSRQDCTVRGVNSDGAAIEFYVTGYGTVPREGFPSNPGVIIPSEPVEHWLTSGTSIHTMMVWFGQTRHVFDQLGLATKDKNIRINIFEPSSRRLIKLGAADTFGYVSPTSLSEMGGIVHLSNGLFSNRLLDALSVPIEFREEFTQSRMQATAVHEYMHHAQTKTDLGGAGAPFFDITNPHADDASLWISEGTAKWFEDFVYDGLDDYVPYFNNDIVGGPLTRVLANGIYSERNNTQGGNPYVLGLFFKLLSAHCATFEADLKTLFFRDYGRNDFYRMDALKDLLSNASCDFGPQAGENEKENLLAAFLLYQYATLYAGPEGRTSKLESDEPDPEIGGLRYEQGSSPLINTDLVRNGIGDSSPGSGLFDAIFYINLPAYSAKSFEIADLFDSKLLLEGELFADEVLFNRLNGQPPAFRSLEAFIRVNRVDSPNGAVKMGVLNDGNPRFIGNSTLDGLEHSFLDSDDACGGEFVYPDFDEYGRGFITFVNDTAQPVDRVTIQMGLRDHVYHKDPARQISIRRDRSLEWEDRPAAATRMLTHAGAEQFCENETLNGHTDWELPELRDFLNTHYQNRSGDGAFIHSAPNAFYWTKTATLDSAGTVLSYATSKGDGERGEITTGIGVPSASLRHVRCVRRGANPNMCEIP